MRRARPGESHDSHKKGSPGLLPGCPFGFMCPECGAPTLFEAPARVAMKCSHCGLDFTEFERGGRFGGMLHRGGRGPADPARAGH